MPNPLMMSDEHIVSIEFVKGEPITNAYEEITNHEKHVDKVIIEYFVGHEAKTKVLYGLSMDQFEEICDCMSQECTRIVD